MRAEKEIQSVLDESLESLSFAHIFASAVAQMNTDGQAKGYVFDGLHSPFSGSAINTNLRCSHCLGCCAFRDGTLGEI